MCGGYGWWEGFEEGEYGCRRRTLPLVIVNEISQGRS